jgi:hypothetical protein
MKFQPGDLARIGGKHRKTPQYYGWLRRGRVARIAAVAGRTKGGHVEYRIDSKIAGPYVMPTYDLRRLDERQRRAPQARKAARQRQTHGRAPGRPTASTAPKRINEEKMP